MTAAAPPAPRSAPGFPLPADVPWCVGVDGGGTATRVRLVAADGHTVLGSGQGGPSALGQGVEQAWKSIRQALDAAFADAGRAPAEARNIALGLGLSGAEVGAWRAAFLAANPGFRRCALASDATALVLGAHAGAAGVVVIGGTGSVAMQRTRGGALHQVGGWGFGLGDEGSGAWLGWRAVQHLARVLDGRAEGGCLSDRLAAVVGSDRAALVAWCRQAGQAGHGELAPLIFAAAEEGEPTASALVQQASEELAALVAALDAREPGLPIVVSGSVALRLWPRWPPALRARVVPARGDAIDGALQLLREAGPGDGITARVAAVADEGNPARGGPNSALRAVGDRA